jgi:hypothetical protein
VLRTDPVASRARHRLVPGVVEGAWFTGVLRGRVGTVHGIQGGRNAGGRHQQDRHRRSRQPQPPVRSLPEGPRHELPLRIGPDGGEPAPAEPAQEFRPPPIRAIHY